MCAPWLLSNQYSRICQKPGLLAVGKVYINTPDDKKLLSGAGIILGCVIALPLNKVSRQADGKYRSFVTESINIRVVFSKRYMCI